MKYASRLAPLVAALLFLPSASVFAAPKSDKATDTPVARYTDSGPEPLLLRIFEMIEGHRWDLALKETESLLKAYPNFRLGHLIRGDLLMARTRPISP